MTYEEFEQQDRQYEEEMLRDITILAVLVMEDLIRDVTGVFAKGVNIYRLPVAQSVVAGHIERLRQGLINIVDKTALKYMELGATAGKVPGAVPMPVIPVAGDVQQALAQYRADRITGVTDEIKNAVTEVINRGVLGNKSLDEIARELRNFLPAGAGPMRNLIYRAKAVAVTEVSRVLNMAMFNTLLESAKQIPNLLKQWITSFVNSRPWHIAAHLQTVPVNEPFVVKGEYLMYPLDPSASAENVVNCKCRMFYVIPNQGEG